MSNRRVTRLRRENVNLREQIEKLQAVMADLDAPDEELTEYEQIQADAIDLVSKLTTLSWVSHQRHRELCIAIFKESSGALDVLDSGGSLNDYREREW